MDNQSMGPAIVFVDGSNMLIEMSRAIGLERMIRADQPSDQLISLACQSILQSMKYIPDHIIPTHGVQRRYWFGSVCGNDPDMDRIKRRLRDNGFEGQLYWTAKGQKEKRVDLAVAREMLIQGFNKNYHTAVLVAGDADYLDLVQDLKRLGRTVCGLFYDGDALAPDLRLACDHFWTMRNPQEVSPKLVENLVNAV